jgi:alkylhydroperoxidase family enzyme
MAFIPMISTNEASGDLGTTYEEIGSARGGVGNILQIQSLNPPSLKAHFDLYKTLMFGRTDLSRVRREMIGVVVSAINRCRY